MEYAKRTQALESLLDGLIRQKGIHSAVCSVVSGDGSFRWSGARGVISPQGAPMTPETPWFIASITKLFIASLVMRLVEEGELALEDRLVELLPRGVTEGLHVLGGQDRTHRITVEHLLAHASGLPDFIEDYPPRGAPPGTDRRSLVEVLLQEGDRNWTLEDTGEWVRGRLTPHFEPQPLGQTRIRIRYSDTNYQLLMGILEARRGAPFHRILEELILAPLGLEHTWLPGHPRGDAPEPEGDAPEPEAAALYGGAEIVRIPRFLASIGDLNSTCHDLVRFLQAMVGGGLFRDDASWPRLTARWNGFAFPRDKAAIRQPGWPIQYGLGVMRFQLPRFFTPLRRMPPVVGHTGSTGTWLFHAPELDLYLVGAVSQITAGAVPFRVVPKMVGVLAPGRG